MQENPCITTGFPCFLLPCHHISSLLVHTSELKAVIIYKQPMKIIGIICILSSSYSSKYR
jgi:hypothetical protein